MLINRVITITLGRRITTIIRIISLRYVENTVISAAMLKSGLERNKARIFAKVILFNKIIGIIRLSRIIRLMGSNNYRRCKGYNSNKLSDFSQHFNF